MFVHSLCYLHSIAPSDIAFEEQEEALAPAGPDEVKVVIATNAAESSITLPDVDDVICLGTARFYDNFMIPPYLLSYFSLKSNAS